jgi:hypothetical protein
MIENYTQITGCDTNQMAVLATTLASSYPSERSVKFQSESRVVRFLVVAVLLCAVACSEVPELTKLIDVSSNDFITSSCLLNEVAATAVAPVTATVKPQALRVVPSQELSRVQQQTIRTRSSRDLLSLCSILRT